MGYMDNSAAGTANMLEKFDHLFDILNASTTKTTNLFRHPYKGTEAQEDFLKQMLNSLKGIKVFKTTEFSKRNISKTFKSISCFQVTIKSIMDLWYDLKISINSLKTRRLNQDCLENFFGKIRQQGGHSVNPTPSQFISAFNRLSCMDLMDCIETFNCAADGDALLLETVLEKECPQQIRNCPQVSFQVFKKECMGYLFILHLFVFSNFLLIFSC